MKLRARIEVAVLEGYCGLLYFATFWASNGFTGLRGTSCVQFESSR